MKKLFSIGLTCLMMSFIIFSLISNEAQASMPSLPIIEEEPAPTITIPQPNSRSVLAPDIVGGQNADQGEYPWQVRVLPGPFLCGGSLIDEEWVLTAAHCVFDQSGSLISASTVTAIMGDHNKNSASNDGTEQVRSVSQIIPHPSYSPNGNDADVALLRLSSPATIIAGQVETIALNTDANIPAGTIATVTGWGALFSGGSTPTTLQEVSVPIVSNQVCSSRYGGGITANMICAGLDEGGKDSCQGDSGGPLIIPSGNGAFEHIGVVSFGIGCADSRFPGVYARTSQFVSWIESQTGPLNVPTPTPSPTSLPTNTPTVTPTPSPTNTPIPGATSTPTPAISPTPTQTAVPIPTGTNLLTNGNFDSDPLGTGWDQSSTQGFPLIDTFSGFLTFTADSDPNLVWLGGANGETSRLSQFVSIPSNGQATLVYKYQIFSQGECGTDTGRIAINSTVIKTFDLCSANQTSDWIDDSLNLSQYSGQNVTLIFEAEADFSIPSSLFIDTAALLFEETVQAPTATPTEIPSTSSGISNGGFEDGNNGAWSEESSNGFDLIYNEANDLPIPPNSGSYVAWLGGANSETSTLSQQITLPSEASELTFAYWIGSADVCGYDFGSVTFGNTALVSYDLCRENVIGQWQTASIDISALAGQEGLLVFEATTDNIDSSSLYIDDVSIVSSASDSPTPSPTPSPSPTPEIAFINLTAESGATAISLNWDVINNINLVEYRVYRQSTSTSQGSGSNFDLIATVSETSYSDSGNGLLETGNAYTYRVDGVSGDGTILGSSELATAQYGSVVLALADVIVPEGGEAIVPLTIRDGTGFSISDANIIIQYDASIIQPIEIEPRPLGAGYNWESNIGTLADVDSGINQLILTVSNTVEAPIYGDGALVWIRFDAIGAAGDRTDIDLKMFQQGIGGSSMEVLGIGEVPLILFDGQLSIEPVEEVAFQLGDVDGNGSIELNDALAILNTYTGTTLNSMQLAAADVNGDGAVDIGDAILILIYLEDGDWPSAASGPETRTVNQTIELTLSNIVAAAGETARIYLDASGLSNISGSNLVLLYDSDLITSIEAVRLVGIGSSLDLLVFGDDGNGQVNIAFAGSEKISGSGAILEITVRMNENATANETSTLRLADANLNDGDGLNIESNFESNTVDLNSASVSVDDQRQIALPFIYEN